MRQKQKMSCSTDGKKSVVVRVKKEKQNRERSRASTYQSWWPFFPVRFGSAGPFGSFPASYAQLIHAAPANQAKQARQRRCSSVQNCDATTHPIVNVAIIPPFSTSPFPLSASDCASPPRRHASFPLGASAPGFSSCAPAAAAHSSTWPAAPAPTCPAPERLQRK